MCEGSTLDLSTHRRGCFQTTYWRTLKSNLEHLRKEGFKVGVVQRNEASVPLEQAMDCGAQGYPTGCHLRLKLIRLPRMDPPVRDQRGEVAASLD